MVLPGLVFLYVSWFKFKCLGHWVLFSQALIVVGGSNWGGAGSVWGGWFFLNTFFWWVVGWLMLEVVSIRWVSDKHRGVVARIRAKMERNWEPSQVEIIWINNRSSDKNFPRKLTGLTGRVAHLNEKTVLIGGIDNNYKDRDEVLCGSLIWFNLIRFDLKSKQLTIVIDRWNW